MSIGTFALGIVLLTGAACGGTWFLAASLQPLSSSVVAPALPLQSETAPADSVTVRATPEAHGSLEQHAADVTASRDEAVYYLVEDKRRAQEVQAWLFREQQESSGMWTESRSRRVLIAPDGEDSVRQGVPSQATMLDLTGGCQHRC